MKSHYASVPLSYTSVKDLKAVQAALSHDARELNLRASRMDGAHLTLSVFRIDKDMRGKEETEEQLIRSINKILQDFLEKRPPLELKFHDLGSFGRQVVFIKMSSVKQLEELRQDVNNLLIKEGIYITDNKFTPHVTLFRQRERTGGAKPKLTVQDMVRRTDLPPVTTSPVRQIVFKRLYGF